MPDRQKLDSWKEIAGFLARDVSTVRRWERVRGLPVHRVPGSRRSAVFAYTDEVTTWLDGGQATPDGSPPPDGDRRRIAVISVSLALLIAGLIATTVVARRPPRTTAHRPATESPVMAAGQVPPLPTDAYLRGRYLLNQRSLSGLNGAVQALNEAVVLNPRSARAYAALADAYIVAGMANAPNTETLPKAKTAADRALDLDAGLADAHTSLATFHALYEWNWRAAEREFTRALELNPEYALGHYWYGTFLLAPLGRFEEAMAQIGRAQELDPLAPYITAGLGQVYYFARRYEQADMKAREALRRDPTFVPAISLLESSYRERHMFTEAIGVRESSVNLVLRSSWQRVAETSGYAGLLRDYARHNEEQALRTYVSPYLVAYYHAAGGEYEIAMRWLQKAHAQHHPALVFLGVEPVFDPLRRDPRLQEIASGVGVGATAALWHTQ